MKRLHVHVSVEDVAQSIRFYSTLFAAEPTVRKSDYAKWMLDDPRVNFAISERGAAVGIEHLGIQVETADELREVCGRLQQSDRPVLEEGAVICCYARSEKSWITDPQGVTWETFLTIDESTIYGHSPAPSSISAGTCRTPETPQDVCCPPKPEPSGGQAACCGSSQGAAV